MQRQSTITIQIITSQTAQTAQLRIYSFANDLYGLVVSCLTDTSKPLADTISGLTVELPVKRFTCSPLLAGWSEEPAVKVATDRLVVGVRFSLVVALVPGCVLLLSEELVVPPKLLLAAPFVPVCPPFVGGAGPIRPSQASSVPS
jgi:hypothetical protein